MKVHMQWCTILTVALFLGSVQTAARAEYSRVTPITEAVKKTSASVLSLKVARKGSQGGKLRWSIGSAFIVDERGYAVTNSHVVHDAIAVRATTADGTDMKAVIVADETPYDIAILKVESNKKLKAVTLGPSSDLMIGETVLAVGNALGFSHTVSRGIISAQGRQIHLPGNGKLSERGLIQTDASINPGNSGGPLININGEVIGMTYAMHGDAQGMAFAIPIDSVKELLCRHLSAHKVNGVKHCLLCAEKIQSEGAHRQTVVVDVIPAGSPAERAGLKSGDHILRVDSRSIANCFDLERAFWETKHGQTVHLDIRRAGAIVKVDMCLPASAAEVALNPR